VLFSADRDTMNRRVQAGYPGFSRMVPMLRLDDIQEDADCLLWNLDVEGMEPDVLEGAAKSLDSPALQAVLMEGRQPVVVERMRQAGFRPCSYDPWARGLGCDHLTSASNQLWVRDPAWIQERLVSAPPFLVLGTSI
jgi:hypothetical protein